MSTRFLLFGCLFFCYLCEGSTFYFVDIGQGNATFVVTPSGETMLLDTGSIRTADRVVAFMTQNGIKKIDYLVVTHFEGDHMGAAPRIAANVPIVNFVDHGTCVTYGKGDDWWQKRRGPWMRGPGWGRSSDKLFDDYTKVRDKGHHITVRAGDRIPVKGLDIRVVSAAGKIITRPLVAGAAAPAACGTVDRRTDDDTEDGQSVGMVLREGEFRFVYLGDLTWNIANSLFCPRNLIGPVDAYLVTHHGQSLSSEAGDFYHGLSCCSAAEVHGLHPRVAFLSMVAEGHKGGTTAAAEVLHAAPGLDLWQTEKVATIPNSPDQFIANIGEKSEQVPYIKMVTNADGSFTVTNSRNQFTKRYPRKE